MGTIPKAVRYGPPVSIGRYDRKILCKREETDRIWQSLLDYPQNCQKCGEMIGAGPRCWKCDTPMVPGEGFVKQCCGSYKYRRHIPKCRNFEHHVWEIADQRCREPGGLVWLGREVLGRDRLWPQLHSAHMGDPLQNALGSSRRYFFEWSRGHYKTTVCALVFPIWALGVEPWHEIMICCSNKEMAKKRLGAIKRHLTRNMTLRTLWPHLAPAKDVGGKGKKLEKWSATGLLIAGKYGDDPAIGFGMDYSVIPVGTEEGIAGEHPTIAVCDDIHQEDEADSLPAVKRVKRFHNELITTVLGRSLEIVVGTPQSINDEYYEIREGKRGGLCKKTILCRDPECDQYHYSIAPLKYRLKLGEPFTYTLPKKAVMMGVRDPARSRTFVGFDADEDRKLKETEPYYHYMSQRQVTPVEEQHRRFRPDDWMVYEEGHQAPWMWNVDPMTPEYVAKAKWIESGTMYAAVDCAEESEKEHDYTSIVVVLIRKGHGYLMDLIYDKMPPHKIVEAIFELCYAPDDGDFRYWEPRPVADFEQEDANPNAVCWRPKIIFGEDQTFGKVLHRSVKEEAKRRGVTRPNVRKVKGLTRVSKKDRILKKLEPLFRHHRLHFPVAVNKRSEIEKRIVDMMELAKQEYDWFLSKGTNDDFLDSLQMMRDAFSNTFAQVETVKPKIDIPIKPHPLEGILKKVDKRSVPRLAPNFEPPEWADMPESESPMRLVFSGLKFDRVRGRR